jgi:hypothetical protein
MEPESNDDPKAGQPGPTPAKKPYKTPALSDYGKATDETQVGRRKAALVDRGSS